MACCTILFNIFFRFFFYFFSLQKKIESINRSVSTFLIIGLWSTWSASACRLKSNTEISLSCYLRVWNYFHSKQVKVLRNNKRFLNWKRVIFFSLKSFKQIKSNTSSAIRNVSYVYKNLINSIYFWYTRVFLFFHNILTCSRFIYFRDTLQTSDRHITRKLSPDNVILDFYTFTKSCFFIVTKKKMFPEKRRIVFCKCQKLRIIIFLVLAFEFRIHCVINY